MAHRHLHKKAKMDETTKIMLFDTATELQQEVYKAYNVLLKAKQEQAKNRCDTSNEEVLQCVYHTLSAVIQQLNRLR